MAQRGLRRARFRVVDNKTAKTTPFNLNPEGSRVEVKKSGDVIYILEREADSLLE